MPLTRTPPRVSSRPAPDEVAGSGALVNSTPRFNKLSNACNSGIAKSASQRIASIPGVGMLTATAATATMGDEKSFACRARIRGLVGPGAAPERYGRTGEVTRLREEGGYLTCSMLESFAPRVWPKPQRLMACLRHSAKKLHRLSHRKLHAIPSYLKPNAYDLHASNITP
jgi:hypothetical protein